MTLLIHEQEIIMLDFRIFLLTIISFFTYTDESMPENDFYLVCDGEYTEGTKTKWLFLWDSAEEQLFSAELYDYDIDAFLYVDEYETDIYVEDRKDGFYYFRGTDPREIEAERAFEINRETLKAEGFYMKLNSSGFPDWSESWVASCQISNYEELDELYIQFEETANAAEELREETLRKEKEEEEAKYQF